MRFGGIVALDGVSFDVPEQAIVGLVGPNGAGKTTLFNCISRLYTPNAGSILFEGRNLLSDPPHAVVRRGVARTFQHLELCRRMTVLDNVLVGLHAQMGSGRLGFLGSALALPSARVAERRAREQALAALDEVGCAALAERQVSGLPTGTLKAVALARALVSRPRLLLLDEPAGGLDREQVEELEGLLLRVHERLRVTLLVVEHHMNLVMRVSDQVVVLDFGKKIADGPPAQVQADPQVIEAYLGTATAPAAGPGDAHATP